MNNNFVVHQRLDSLSHPLQVPVDDMKDLSGVSVQLFSGIFDPNGPPQSLSHGESYSINTLENCQGKTLMCYTRVCPGQPFYVVLSYTSNEYNPFQQANMRHFNAFRIELRVGEGKDAKSGILYLTNDEQLLEIGGNVVCRLRRKTVDHGPINVFSAEGESEEEQTMLHTFAIDGIPWTNPDGSLSVGKFRTVARTGGEGSGVEDLEYLDLSSVSTVEVLVELVKLKVSCLSRALPRNVSSTSPSVVETIPAGNSCKAECVRIPDAPELFAPFRSFDPHPVGKFIFKLRSEVEFKHILANEPTRARWDGAPHYGIRFLRDAEASLDPDYRLPFLENAVNIALFDPVGFSKGPSSYLDSLGHLPISSKGSMGHDAAVVDGISQERGDISQCSEEDDISADLGTKSSPQITSSCDLTDVHRLNPEFASMFPNGFETIDTSAAGLQCGLVAAMASLQQQYPDIPDIARMTIHDLRLYLIADRVSDALSANGFVNLSNTSYLSVDQVALIVRVWGEDHNLNLQLGVVQNDEVPCILGNSALPLLPTTYFIYNNNIEAEGQGGLNHFQGLRARAVLAEQTTTSDVFDTAIVLDGLPGVFSPNSPAVGEVVSTNATSADTDAISDIEMGDPDHSPILAPANATSDDSASSDMESDAVMASDEHMSDVANPPSANIRTTLSSTVIVSNQDEDSVHVHRLLDTIDFENGEPQGHVKSSMPESRTWPTGPQGIVKVYTKDKKYEKESAHQHGTRRFGPRNHASQLLANGRDKPGLNTNGPGRESDYRGSLGVPPANAPRGPRMNNVARANFNHRFWTPATGANAMPLHARYCRGPRPPLGPLYQGRAPDGRYGSDGRDGRDGTNDWDGRDGRDDSDPRVQWVT